ncbi:MAG: sensor histidine kinase N-terminal domain-containing protein [Pseudomonadota bacterium]
MAANLSLRARLTVIILTPLVVISWLVGVWAVVDAQNRADDRFDRALLSAALAVSRDVAVSGGDALSPETNALLRDSFSGPVFYHVFAPDGAFVTGYATPPVPVGAAPVDARGQQVFVGIHQSREVVALRFVDTMQVEGWSGDYTITVWQDLSFRRALVRDLVRSSLLVISLLMATVALVVWFGVRFGLRPCSGIRP